MRNKIIFTIAPMILCFGALTGCNGGDTPTPEKTLTKIEVKPTQNTYTVGYEFKSSDIGTFQATYSDGSTTSIKEGYTSDPELPYTFKDTDVEKGKDFNFTYKEKSSSFHVNVIDPTTKYTVSLSVEPADAGVVSGDGEYEVGKSVTVIATPKKGYTFAGWYEGGTTFKSSEASYTFNMPSNNVSLSARFNQTPEPTKYQLTLVSDPTDIGTTLSGGGTYAPDTPVTISATAVSGYTFLGWYDGDTKKSDQLSFSYTTGNSAKTLTAKFEQDKYTVSISSNPTEGGSSSVSKGSDLTYGEEITLTATANNGYTFLGFYDGDTKLSGTSPYTYTVPGSKNLTAKFEEDVPAVIDFYTCPWSHIANKCNKLEDGSFTDSEFVQSFTFDSTPATQLSDFIGKERTIKVNNQDHRIRVIGTKHDKDANDNTLALTFEFANLISDSEGNSLTYQWNDCNDASTSNNDFINSTLRYALTGNGNNCGKTGEKANEILVAQKGQTSWSDTYKNKTVISMLPADLTSCLKTVKKTVGIGPSYVETSFTDKLFITSGNEIGFTESDDRGYGTKYAYYGTSSSLRVKKQVNGTTILKNSTQISEGSGQTYEGYVYNHSGENFDSDNTKGGSYFTRSPRDLPSYPGYAMMADYNGYVNSSYAIKNTEAVAPAFCF